MTADESVTLTARTGSPLEDERVRETVVSTAQAIAERNGVTITSLLAEGNLVRVSVAEGQVAALGLASELRRSTERWYRQRFDGLALWSESS